MDDEDMEEEELDIEGELDDNDTPPWDIYGETDLDGGDLDDMTEDTALLRTTAAKTEIIVTPISPVSIFYLAFVITVNWVIIQKND